MARSIALFLITIVAVLGAVACGGDGSDGTATETTTEESSAGREVFVASCGSCHTFSDAGTSGAVGPNLDETNMTQTEIELQVRNGGNGMPAFEGELTDEEIEQVSAYVAG